MQWGLRFWNHLTRGLQSWQCLAGQQKRWKHVVWHVLCYRTQRRRRNQENLYL